MAESTVHIDNDRVTVTEWALVSGAATGMHRHAVDYVVVPLTDGRLELTGPSGESRTAELTAGVPYYRSAGVEHDTRNIGTDTVVFMEIELT